ncbi:MAG TPA: PQQ-dependent sugar dehydrogenase, partial [Polyangiaceae bacterium]
PLGQLAYLDRQHVIRAIGARVPMNLEALKAHPIFKDPRFVLSYFRTIDLLIVPRTPATFDLYVSHHRFSSAACFEFVVSRTEGQVSDRGLEVSDAWKEVFVARPCMQTKETDLLWGGLESGGRMAMRDGATLLVTIGDHQFDGVRSAAAAAQDPNLDLGKIVAIDLPSRSPRILTSGHRNPQGLLVARDGTIWETEHGPQGGDEVNLIREGLNYGWPRVTYGMEYGNTPRRPWPINPEQGRHDGYELPAFAFVPSIAISNLIQPDPREWPLWRDHLLVASFGGYLRGGGGKLYLLRVERDNRIVYSEEIVIPVEAGEKLRDIESLSDGRFAVLTDRGTLMLFRNKDGQATSVSPRENDFNVTLDVTAKAEMARIKPIVRPSPVEVGRQLFGSKCASCHSLDGHVKIGPPLNGVIGRRIGAVREFSYSSGMRGADGVWDHWRLADFLQGLESPFPGSPMPPPRLSAKSSRAIAAYLKEQ